MKEESPRRVAILDKRLIYVLIVTYLTITLSTALGGLYANYSADRAAENANHQWCQILAIYHDAYHGKIPPNSSAQGRELIAALEDKYHSFHCE